MSKLRIITPEQYQEGYWTFAGGKKMNHRYEVVSRDSLGNYVVREPEALEALSNTAKGDEPVAKPLNLEENK
jgi:hypothetical protein